MLIPTTPLLTLADADFACFYFVLSGQGLKVIYLKNVLYLFLAYKYPAIRRLLPQQALVIGQCWFAESSIHFACDSMADIRPNNRGVHPGDRGWILDLTIRCQYSLILYTIKFSEIQAL